MLHGQAWPRGGLNDRRHSCIKAKWTFGGHLRHQAARCCCPVLNRIERAQPQRPAPFDPTMRTPISIRSLLAAPILAIHSLDPSNTIALEGSGAALATPFLPPRNRHNTPTLPRRPCLIDPRTLGAESKRRGPPHLRTIWFYGVEVALETLNRLRTEGEYLTT